MISKDVVIFDDIDKETPEFFKRSFAKSSKKQFVCLTNDGFREDITVSGRGKYKAYTLVRRSSTIKDKIEIRGKFNVCSREEFESVFADATNCLRRTL